MAFATTPWQSIDETWQSIIEEWGAIVTGNALIGWENLILDGAITASSETTAQPVSNLQNNQGYSAWQTSASLSAYFDVDAGAAVDWRMVGIFRTNLTDAATVRIKLGTTQGGTDVYDSGSLTGVARNYGQLVHDLGQDYSARYLRVEITDLSNPDGFIKVGLAYAGPAFQPERNFSLNAAQEKDISVAEVVTRGGAEFPTFNFSRRAWDLTFDLLEEDEVFGDLMDLVATAEQGANIMLMPFPGSSFEQKMAVFGRLQRVGRFGLPAQDIYNWNFRLTERL